MAQRKLRSKNKPKLISLNKQQTSSSKLEPKSRSRAKPKPKPNSRSLSKQNILIVSAKPAQKIKARRKRVPEATSLMTPDAALKSIPNSSRATPLRGDLPPASSLQIAFRRETKRLVIRPLELGDFEVWRNAFRSFHPSKNEWDAGGMSEAEISLREFKDLLREQAAERRHDRFYHFGIFLKKSGRFIGATALMDISRGVFHNAYLGYWLGNIHWGQGYASEATRATIDIGFEDLRLHRLEAGIAPANKRSVVLAKGLGLRREGLSRKRIFVEGAWQDMILYAITSEDRGYSFEP